MTRDARTTAIVPTVGQSAWLPACLEALRRSGGGEMEILLVAQGENGRAHARAAAKPNDRLLELEGNVGFAAANNRGFEEAQTELVALVNDDVVVADGWYPALAGALDADPGVAAVQGVHLRLDDPSKVDGCGLAWNRWWQAVQIGHGETPPAAAAPNREIFGVSATAAIYRRRALEEVADKVPGTADKVPGTAVFDPLLFAYYEDVELAGRLAAAGHRSLLVPSARASHAGSTSGRRLGLGGWPLIYGNRHLVLARLLGRRYAAALPRAATRDVLDLLRALWTGQLGRSAGIVAGWGRALRHLPRYLHLGAPVLASPGAP